VTRTALYRRSIKINDNISVIVPTVGDIVGDDGCGEDKYFNLVAMLTASPIDMMVQLDDIGVDFTEIDDFALFLLLFDVIKESDTSLIFGSLNLNDFRTVVNPNTGDVVLRSQKDGTVIDSEIHRMIADALRLTNHLKKDDRKPGNAEAKEYMIERARKKMQRKKNRAEESQLESLIVAIVNTEQFKYNYTSALDLTIYQFNESVHQIIKKVEFDNRMHGIYAGTVSAKDLSQDDLNWLTHK